VGFVSSFATLTVAGLGCKFSIENERFDGGTIRQGALHACITTLRPGALHERSVSGCSGTFGLDARRRSTLEIFSSSVSEPTYTDAICRRKFRVWLNKNATVRMCGCLPRLPAQNPSLRAQQSSRPQVRFVVVSVFPKYQFRLITKLDHKT